MKKKLLLSSVLLLSLSGVSGAFAASTDYTVQQNDTFWTVSQKFGIPLASILSANPSINPNNLIVGTHLVIPQAVNSTPTVAKSTTYTVEKGDTFWVISQKLQISVADLMKANPSVSVNNVYTGLILNLPSVGAYQQTVTWEQKVDAIIAAGMTQLHVPYVFGGATEGVAFDCSGFTQYAFSKVGIYLPHSSEMQSSMGSAVAKMDLRKGDLIFLKDTYKAGVSHVAIYIGNNQILQAGTLGTREVKVSTLFGSAYYDTHYWGAKRIIN